MLIATVSLVIMVVAIYLLAIVTDEFFIESLDKISQIWQLPSNVAGASLMAMGSSAPELAIALLALFKDGGAHSDVGIGTIVGSAVFNILVITGASAIARPAKITWRVVARDCLVYVVCVGLLLVTFRDGSITLLEAALFLVVYGGYIVLLFQWNNLVSPALEPEVFEEIAPPTPHNRGWHHQLNELVVKGIGLLMGDARQSYIRAFLVSVAFIAAISWVLVDSAVIFAETIGIPPVIVALTILAGGTSVPDMISSVIVARQGRGDMAIANAVGSNIFDILVGLGLPWLIVLLFWGQAVEVGTGNLWFSTIILLATVFLLFALLTTERLLSRAEGWTLVGAYAVYVVWTWLGG